MKNYLNTVTGIILFTALLASLQTTASTANDNADELPVSSRPIATLPEIVEPNKEAENIDIQPERKAAEKTSPASSEAYLEQVRINGKLQAAEAAYNLSILASNRNDFTLARKLIEESIQLNQANPHYFAFAAGLAFQAREYDRAAIYQTRVLEIARSMPGVDDLQVALILDQLGTIYFKQKYYENAKSSLLESLQLREKALGASHLQVAASLNKLATLAAVQGQPDVAEAMLKRSLNIARDVSGPQHPNTATMLAMLADFYQSESRMEEAEPLYKEAISIWRESSADPLTIAACQTSLGQLLLSQKRFDDARLQYEQALLLLRKGYAQDHPYVQQAIKNITNLDIERKRNAERDAMYNELVRELSAQSNKHM